MRASPIRRPSSRPRPLTALAALAVAVVMLASSGLPAAAAAPAQGLSQGAHLAPPAAATYPQTIADTRAAVAQLLADPGVSSISVALVDRGQLVWQEGAGHADATTGRVPTADTLYGIGSVSKVITTMAVMTLVDRGRVSLDTPVVRYVRDFRMASPEYRRITVRQLLNHTAGLPGTDYRNWSLTAPYPGYAAQFLATVAAQRLKTRPGAMAVYCNDCFTLAQILVERVARVPFATYVRRAILAPLGMTTSRYATTAFAADSTARLYDPATDALLPQEYVPLLGTGGLYSTTAEMARLAAMLMGEGVYQGRRVLSRAAVAEMGSNQMRHTLNPAALNPFVYGLGWDTVREAGLAAVGVRALYKSGGTSHYAAGLLVAPKEDLGVVVLSAEPEASQFDCETLAQRIALHALVERGTLTSLPAPLGATTLATRTPTARQLAAIEGIYLGQGRTFKVSARPDGTLVMAVPASATTWATGPSVFSLRTDGAFWTAASPGVSIRAVKAQGRTYLVYRMAGGVGHYAMDLTLGQRTAPGQPLSAAWQARVGKVWVLANELPTSLAWTAGPAIPVSAIPDLPGYLDVGYYMASAPVRVGRSDMEARMFLVVPIAVGRDLQDLVMERRGAEEWLHWGGIVARPLDSVPALAPGAGAIAIGAEGYAEWRAAAADTAVALTGAQAWKVLDGELTVLAAGDGDAEGVAVPAGGYLVVFASAGASVGVTSS